MTRYHLLPCRWRGGETTAERYECRSPLLVKQDSDVPAHWCMTCHVRDQGQTSPPAELLPAAGQVRHLAYHLYPRGSEWRPNMEQLRRRMSVFNGRRVIAVAVDHSTSSVEDVAAELAGLDVSIVQASNSAELREMATYPTLMRMLSVYQSAMDVHWYGHGKGVTSIEWALPVREWREAMYSAQLDYWPAIRRLLSSSAAVGQFMRPMHVIPGSTCQWHFSGCFSWRRHLPLFKREWDTYDIHWCGSESHLGRLLARSEVHSLYGDVCAAGLGLYLEEVWAGGMRQQHRAWCEAHMADRQEPILVSVILTAARQAELVHEAIASVRAQTTDSWQLLVVDAGELAAAGAYDRYAGDARVQVMTTGETPEQRAGIGIQGWAINEAWRRGRVRGDLVVCLSDDDVLDPGWLVACIDAARAHPDQAAWHGRAERWAVAGDGQGQLLGVLAAEGVAGPGRQLRGVIDGMQLCCRRSAWRAWPEDRRRRRHADGWWMDAIAADTPVHPLAALVGRHRHTPLSTFDTAGGPVGVDG